MSLAATATDADGTVTRVEFFNGTTKLGEDTTAPFTIAWNVGAAGTYTITARATDNAGAATTSSAVTVTVTKKK
jgi:chitinase